MSEIVFAEQPDQVNFLVNELSWHFFVFWHSHFTLYWFPRMIMYKYCHYIYFSIKAVFFILIQCAKSMLTLICFVGGSCLIYDICIDLRIFVPDSCFFLARTCISIMIGQWILNLLYGIKKGGIWRYQKGNQNPLFEEQIIQDWAIMNATKKKYNFWHMIHGKIKKKY
jgi:hypothetical protein